MNKKQVLVVGAGDHIDHDIKKMLVAEGMTVLDASVDESADRFEFGITMPPKLPELPTLTRNETFQHGPRKKRGKGNKYHRV